MKSRIVQGLLGKISVEYNCPHCGKQLLGKDDEIGKNDICPACEKSFVVPGTLELRKFEEDRELEQQKKQEAKSQAKRKQTEVKQQQTEVKQQLSEEKQRNALLLSLIHI